MAADHTTGTQTTQAPKPKLQRILNLALPIQQEAPDYDSRGFYCRLLLLATLPHSRPDSPIFTRTTGPASLTIMAPPHIGLPYGPFPILMNTWMVTEAIRTRSRTLNPGDSYRRFLRTLKLSDDGNTMRRFRAQVQRLLASTITVTVHQEGREGLAISTTPIASRAILFWDTKNPDQPGLFEHNEIVLSEDYYKEILAHPVPIDLRIIDAIKQSPLALNLYMLLTYTYSRMSALNESSRRIPLRALMGQLGSSYPATPTGLRNFKHHAAEHLRTIKSVYQQAQFTLSDGTLTLYPSQPSITQAS